MVQIPAGQTLGVAQREQGDDQIRVVHVAPTAFGSEGLYGGGERYPLELTRALAAEVDCELITFGRRRRNVTGPGGLRIRVLPALLHLRGHPAHPFAPSLGAALGGVDVVHTHHLRSTPSRMAAVTCRLRSTPVVTTDHGLGGGGWAGLLPRLFDRFLAVSDYSAQTLHVPPDRTRVIYGGADPHRYYPVAGHHRRGVLYVGRLTPHKGIDRLLRALPHSTPLTVAGSAGHDPALPEREYPRLLRRLAAGRDVRFAGAVPDSLLPAMYRSAAVFVLPSVHRTCYGRDVAISELLGLSVLEAMASGTPVVCSRVGGLGEVVRDGETGFLVEPGNIEELSDRLRMLLDDPRLAQQLGANARQLVLDHFTWQACAHRCLAAYRELVRP